MIKPDDSRLDPSELRAVEDRARKLLDRASAWGTLPTPIEDILEEARLQIAPTSIFDPARILAFINKKTAEAAHRVKSALSKVLGIYDYEDRMIHIDDTVTESKQRFLKLHETGHHELPTHRKIFRFFQDCEKTLAPETADLFEREANNFARFALFQGDTYARMAADCKFEIRTPIKLGCEVHAHHCTRLPANRAHQSARLCRIRPLSPSNSRMVSGAQAAVRRIEPSPSYERQFGRPRERFIKRFWNTRWARSCQLIAR